MPAVCVAPACRRLFLAAWQSVARSFSVNLTAHAQRTSSSPSGVRLEISPNPAYVDEPVRIRLRGLAPGCKAVLRAITRDDDDRTWTSHAEFRADSSGCIDPAINAAQSGTYRGVSPMGLFWSMRLPDEFADGRAIFAKKNVEP